MCKPVAEIYCTCPDHHQASLILTIYCLLVRCCVSYLPRLWLHNTVSVKDYRSVEFQISLQDDCIVCFTSTREGANMILIVFLFCVFACLSYLVYFCMLFLCVSFSRINWLDRLHCFINTSMCSSCVEFDEKTFSLQTVNELLRKEKAHCKCGVIKQQKLTFVSYQLFGLLKFRNGWERAGIFMAVLSCIACDVFFV